MIAYHCYYNAIIADPFKSFSNKHRLVEYGSIMQRLKDRNMLADLQILDNNTSAEYKCIVKAEWGVEHQFVPPHIHYINAAEHAIRIFKPYFMSVLAGISNNSPKNLWDLLIPQTEWTINLLRQSTLNPKI